MKHLYVVLLLVCFSFPARAQQTVKKDSVLSREMTLEKEYNPTIRDAFKLNQLPELREPQTSKSQVAFSNYATPYEVQSGLNYLPHRTYLTDLNYSKNRGYLTAGVSSLLDIDGDLGYQILHSGKDQLGIFASHRSSNCEITSLQVDEEQKFKINDNWGGLNYLHHFGKVKLNLDAKYTYSAFNYSGLTISNLGQILFSSTGPIPPIFAINDYLDQTNNFFEAHAGVASEETTKTKYAVNAVYTNFRQKSGLLVDEQGKKENRILLDWDFHQKTNDSMGAGFAGFFKNYTYGEVPVMEPLDCPDYSVLSLNPYFYLEGDNLNLFLGGKVDVEFGGRKKVVGAPTIRFNYYPTDKFMFYLTADGGRKDNSNYNTFYENRYVDPVYRIWDSRTPFDGTTGIRFIPVSNVSVDIFGGYKITMDEHFFLPSFRSGVTAYMPEYNDANTLKAGANFKYTFQDIFEFDLKGVFYHWEITTKAENDASTDYLQAWHKPNFTTDLNAAYRLSAIPLKFNLAYRGEFGRKMNYTFSPRQIQNMRDIHDLSAKATYSITKNFSAYAAVHNLLFQKYEIWYGYPAQNFNIMAGVNVLF
jgi:hypothetical protein